ncbi:uncharacterized protein P884DRAFT_204839 [Thermothelomyces heterothallicus CBS 202.75]|uniref:uncharacterized protein n=1 Tax=Thermothelomyces heterothallicus CBS 202.75 TaxID=1149848 RepID=UPI003743A81B
MASPLEAAASRPSSGVASPPPRITSRSRTQSISSDRPSTVAHSLMTPPLAVSPEPAFIAASAASQIVTNDYDSHAEAWYDQHGIEPPGEAATVSPTALQLVNSFLDQLLFNFLSVSRSTALCALRPAVTEVLKPKLAKDAINQADEELREYLGEDGEYGAQPQTADAVSPAGWDLELAWKRTRLRCMVYSSLGDMEEEDEDYYMEQGHLGSGPDDKLSESVSPAVAIFLTSILEFMGEQALIIAGQAAYHRIRAKYEKELKEGARSPTGVADKVVIEDLDMERVALDRTLGRLWRSWKKKIRSPAISSTDRLNRSYSKDSLYSSSGHLRSSGSVAEFAVPATVPEPDAEPGAPSSKKDPADDRDQGANTSQPLEEHLVAASIPLPLGPDDIAEIEVPGLAFYRHEREEDGDAEKERTPTRPKSMISMPLREAPGPLSTASSQHQITRRRSSTLPAPARPRFSIPAEPRPDVPVEMQDSPGQASRSTCTLSQSAAEAAEQVQAVETSQAADSGVAPGGEELKDEIKDDDDDDEVSIEEPRIVRSSRVSILARTPSTTSSEPGKPASINTNLPIRMPSIHSARLIEVTSPRSPVVGSRRNSVAVTESARHASPSSTNRTVTPPLSEDRQEQSVGSSSVGRPAISHGTRSSGLASSVSISESGEPADRAYAVSPVTPVTTHAPAHAATSLPTFPEPSTPPKPVIKNAILPATSSPVSTASTTSATFFIESMPVLPKGREAAGPSQTGGRRYRSPSASNPPAVPERSAGRQAVANTSALRQPVAIGQVSVERTRDRSLSQGSSSSRPREPSAGRGRQQTAADSPSSTKLKTVQTSEEQVQSRIDVVRNFEELIQSDQTIQYTLTPESMRDLESQGQSGRPATAASQVVSIKTRKSEEACRNGSRSPSSSVPRNDAKSPSSAPRSSGSGSHSVTDGHHPSRSFGLAPAKHNGVVPRSIPPVPSKPRATNGPQARDARLERESLAEFAEFIRSTGPDGARAASANANGSSGSGRRRNQGSISNGDVGTTSLASATSNPNRPRLQPRGAVADHKDDNSDLIDFIRRGPPGSADNPRIPRSVAPFRTTMDSDQLDAAVGGRAVDAQLRDAELADSQVSTNATDSSVPPSVQSSINSRSALVAKNKPLPSDAGDVDMPMPKRKTRRVRDPYAIDLSDEELEDDDEFTPLPRKRVQTQEESLIDFLNNYTPPPEPPVQPFSISQTRNAMQPKKKASTSSLMARFTRRDSAQSSAAGSTVSAASKVPETRSASGRASAPKGGHVPIQVNIPESANTHENSNGNSAKAAAMMGGGGPGPVRGRVPMKKFEPREAISVPTRATSDLAEFLKQSGPPVGTTPMANDFSETAGRYEASGISKVFSRRKKPSVSHPRRMPESE